MAEETGTTLREQLAANLEAVEAPVVEPVETTAPEGETAEQKAERLRDDKGRFAKSDGVAEAPVSAKPAPDDKGATGAALGGDPKPRPPRPSSWKKDYWDHWDKLDPGLADYLHQRESEYAKGVSTYKGEADRAKEIWDAIAPFQPDLQRHGIQPAQWIQNLGTAHQRLAMGSPQDKLAMFQKLATDYGVPAALAVQGQDGNWRLLNQQPQPQQPQQAPDVRKLVQEELQQQYTQQEIKRFAEDKEKHPHYDTVRQTMAGLLQSGLAENLEDAYQAALRLPQHSDIYDAMQKQQRDADEKRKQEEAAAKARQAKANHISPRSSTPSSATAVKGEKGLRANLEAAFEEHTASRV
jgi:hypothetical protein